jgi:Domain of unknown function (DUF4383)
VTKRVRVELEDFAWEALRREADEYGISVEELVAYASLYYLADRDSGRITRWPLAIVPETDGRDQRRAERRRRRERPRRLAGVFGMALVLFGLAGFIVSANFTAGGAVHGEHILGVFEINGWHNLLHILSGIILFTAAQLGAPLRATAIPVATAYGLVALYGFLGGSELAGLVPINAADNVLHLVLSGIALGTVALTRRRSPSSRTLGPA